MAGRRLYSDARLRARPLLVGHLKVATLRVIRSWRGFKNTGPPAGESATALLKLQSHQGGQTPRIPRGSPCKRRAFRAAAEPAG